MVAMFAIFPGLLSKTGRVDSELRPLHPERHQTHRLDSCRFDSSDREFGQRVDGVSAIVDALAERKKGRLFPVPVVTIDASLPGNTSLDPCRSTIKSTSDFILWFWGTKIPVIRSTPENRPCR